VTSALLPAVWAGSGSEGRCSKRTLPHRTAIGQNANDLTRSCRSGDEPAGQPVGYQSKYWPISVGWPVGFCARRYTRRTAW